MYEFQDGCLSCQTDEISSHFDIAQILCEILGLGIEEIEDQVEVEREEETEEHIEEEMEE